MSDGGVDLETVLERIRDVRNFDFRNYKRATLRRRVERRMHERGCRTFADYLALLEHEPEEFDLLISQMLIKVTSFFRDEEVWKELGSRVIPGLLAQKRSGEGLRVWCAGCSTGEEAFTLAILIAEALGAAFATADVKVFGTDVDNAAVAFARRGIYPAERIESVPKDLLARWFVKGPEGYTIRKEIRRVVVFGVNNLVSDAPISRLDLVVCRNVFIYLDAQLQKRVLARFHYALRHNGVLVLGRSELIPFAARIFEPLDLSSRIYRKDQRSDLPLAAQENLLRLIEREETGRRTGRNREEVKTVNHFDRDVLNALPQPIITTAPDGTVTFWNAAAARTWGRAEADVIGRRLSTLGLSGLTGDLLIERTAAVRDGQRDSDVADGTIVAAGESAATTYAVHIRPLRSSDRALTGLIYVFVDTTAQRGLEQDLRLAMDESRGNHQKLHTSNEDLRSSNEELETTNEELQSANEELQTTNEELQSTNEELETTNEELQSTNAELDTTNRELAHRTEEMHLMSFYQRTIIRSLTAAVIVLDPKGRITTWNLASERLLGLPESEAVGQLLWTLRIPAIRSTIVARIRKAITNGRALRIEDVSYELPVGGRGHAIVAAVPLVDGGTQLGAVVLFEDTTRAVALAEENATLQDAARPKKKAATPTVRARKVAGRKGAKK